MREFLHRIDDHFGIGILVSNRDWEGAGVERDIRVKAADAVAAAEKLPAMSEPSRKFLTPAK
jgi:hypothetical protein